ncbi:helix-turn-helix domain-containing protein [Amorphus sp. MBR-141]
MSDEGFTSRLRECANAVGGGNVLAQRSGIPRRTLESYLSGAREPKVTTAARIAAGAGVSVEWLANGKGAMRPEPPNPPSRQQGGSVDGALLRDVSRVVAAVHKSENVRLPSDVLIDEAATAYNELLARAEDPSDRDELESLLPWLEARLRKRLKAAREEPGTGKRSA